MKTRFYILSIAFFAIIANPVWAQDSGVPVAKVISTKGKPVAKSADNSTRDLKFGSKIFEDDILSTDESSRLQIRYTESLDIKSIAENTQYKVKRSGEPDSEIDGSEPSLFDGAIRALSGAILKKNERINKEETRVAATAIAGTLHFLACSGGECVQACYAGNIDFWNAKGASRLGLDRNFHIARARSWNIDPEYLLNEPASFITPFVPVLASQILGISEFEDFQESFPFNDAPDADVGRERDIDNGPDTTYNPSNDDFYNRCSNSGPSASSHC